MEFLAVCLGLSALPFANSAFATSDTWTGATDGTWATSTNWASNPATVPGSGDTATFNGASANTTIDLGTGVTIGALLFDTASAAAYTIGSGSVGSQTLTMGTTGNAITMNSTVANDELVNSNLALSTTGTYTLTNNSTTNALTIAGGVSASTTGTKILGVTGAGNTAISGAITAGSGAMNLLKQGTGTLTLSGGGALGASAITGFGGTFSAVLLGGTTKISSGTYTSAGEFVVGGYTTNGGAGVNTNFTMDGGSLTISNWLSLGRGNGVGAVSSDIVLNNSASLTASNFSAGFNGGGSANQPKGTFTMNGASTFSVTGTGAFTLGESPGANMTMTLNGTSAVTVGTGVTAIGNQNGTGILNINSGTTFTNGGEIRVAYSGSNGTYTGSGTINVNGGTLQTQALTLGRNNNDVASTLSGTVNLNSGTVNVTSGGALIGWRGTATTGTLNISGGSFNLGTTATTSMNVGSFSGSTGSITVSGGALNLENNSSLTFSNVNAVSTTGTLTISGGTVAFYSDAGTTAGGTGVVDLMNKTGTGTNTLNLNGGTLAANQIKASNNTGTRVINFNGGTLMSSSSSLASTFLASGVATTANVRNGGAIIDTNGNSVTIGQALLHSSIGGDNATDGGLTKNGTGTLTLTGTNTYTGVTTVVGGTLATSGTGILGTGNITLDSNVTLTLGNNISLGDAATLTFNSGTTINMNFSGSDTLAGITNGTISIGPGSYTAAQLDSFFGGGNFVDSGVLGGVLTIVAVPEPKTSGMVIAGVAMLVILGRRRQRRS